MDYSFPTSNPSSCGSSSGGGGSGGGEINRKEKMKKSCGGGCSGGGGGSGGKRSKGVVKLSTDPQSVAARERRHRISDRFKILQSLVPGGTKMDTVSMLDEAIHYVKFLKTQIWLHQTMINFVDFDDPSAAAAAASSSGLPLDPNGGDYCGHVNNNILYPPNDVVKMEEPLILPPQFDPTGYLIPSGQDQFMCSYDAYMNF